MPSVRCAMPFVGTKTRSLEVLNHLKRSREREQGWPAYGGRMRHLSQAGAKASLIRNHRCQPVETSGRS